MKFFYILINKWSIKGQRVKRIICWKYTNTTTFQIYIYIIFCEQVLEQRSIPWADWSVDALNLPNFHKNERQ